MDKEKLDRKKLEYIAMAAGILNRGGIVAFPTETVYGLGAEITHETAVQKIYEIKRRPTNHPLIVHISDSTQARIWAREIPEPAWTLARHFWPGPLTLILKRSRLVPDYVTGGQNTVGIRIPAHPVALALLNAIGPDKAIAAPSANLFGKISPTSAAHVKAALNKKVDMILDGGACEIGLESTIIGFDHTAVLVLRPGGISVSAIEKVLNKPVIMSTSKTPETRVSGSLASHYAPVTPLRLYPAAEIFKVAHELAAHNQRTVVITWSEIGLSRPDAPNIHHVCMPQDPIDYGKHLYATLHQYDQTAFDYILMETPPKLPAWLAISDRLQRASFSHI